MVVRKFLSLFISFVLLVSLHYSHFKTFVFFIVFMRWLTEIKRIYTSAAVLPGFMYIYVCSGSIVVPTLDSGPGGPGFGARVRANII